MANADVDFMAARVVDECGKGGWWVEEWKEEIRRDVKRRWELKRLSRYLNVFQSMVRNPETIIDPDHLCIRC